ncbi:MAG: copper chaperone PCu(A)C [Pseudomonadota bacterium]
MRRLLFVAAALLLGAGEPAQAHDFKVGTIVIDHPWARPTIPNRPTAGYFGLANTGGEGDRLLSATSAAFGRTELHRTDMKDGVMSMNAVETVEIPAGESVAFEPRGLHVMLFDPVEQLAEGDRFDIELVFENAGPITVEMYVERRASKGEGHDHGHGKGHGHDHGHDHGEGHGEGHGSHGTTGG